MLDLGKQLSLEEIERKLYEARRTLAETHSGQNNRLAHTRALRDVHYWKHARALWHCYGKLVACSRVARIEPDDWPGIAIAIWCMVGDLLRRTPKEHRPDLNEREQAILDLARDSFNRLNNADATAGVKAVNWSAEEEAERAREAIEQIERSDYLSRDRLPVLEPKPVSRAKPKASPKPKPPATPPARTSAPPPIEKLAFPDRPAIRPTEVGTRRGDPCAYCGERGDTLDHVIPRAAGGADIAINRVACCLPCNNAKADTMLSGVEYEPNGVALFPSRVDWPSVRVQVAEMRAEAERRLAARR